MTWRKTANVLQVTGKQGALVYFVQAGARGPIKIGSTTNLSRRFATLQTYNSQTLRLLATEPGDIETERAYHQRFDAAALTGEWFKPVPDLLALIDEIVERYGTPPQKHKPNLPQRRRPGTGSTPMRNVRIGDTTWQRVTTEAERTGTTASDVIRAALDAHLHLDGYLDRRP